MVTTQDAEFDHRSLIYLNIEFQKRCTKLNVFQNTPRGGFEDPRIWEYVLEGPKSKRSS